MDKKVYDANWVLREVGQLVEEYGNGYRYLDHHNSCSNFENVGTMDEKPSCIVGQLFSRAGLTFKECGNGSIYFSSAMIKSSGADVEFTPEALVIMSAMQSIQDGGGTWGTAYSAASGIRSGFANFISK